MFGAPAAILLGMTRGFTLVELLLAVALLAAVAGIAIPRLQRPLDRLAVERVAYDLAAAHFRARTTAIARNSVTLLMVSPDSIRMRIMAGRDTVAKWAREGGAAYGVQVTGSSRWLRFHPAGIGFGVANGSWTISRGATQRRVIVSRLGRLRVAP
jgi:prepilin-type N-terminal cleavage/methylation domain-containing protein